jgi:hypothetical protein
MKRKNSILKYLAEEDRAMFLSELLDAIALSKKQNSFAAIDECLNAWEATAEMTQGGRNPSWINGSLMMHRKKRCFVPSSTRMCLWENGRHLKATSLITRFIIQKRNGL